MPSQDGPYVTIQETDTFRNRVFWYVANKNGFYVNEFLNGKADAIEYDTLALAQQGASNLSNDDTAYLAVVQAHYAGGSVTITGTGGATAKGFINQAISDLALIVQPLQSDQQAALTSAKDALTSAINAIT